MSQDGPPESKHAEVQFPLENLK